MSRGRAELTGSSGLGSIVDLAVYFILYLAPVLLAVSFNWAYGYWLVSAAALAGLIMLLWQRSRPFRVMAFGLNTLTLFAGFVLGSSLYLQGTGFNEQYFFHLNGETFAVAREAYPLVFFGSFGYWIVASLWLLRVPKDLVSGSRRHLALLSGVGLLAWAPLLSLASYSLKETDEYEIPALAPSVASGEVKIHRLAEPRNLVLVFAESLEMAYSDPARFGQDQTPALTALSREAVRFTDMREVSATGWTMGGMVAAMCGLPINTKLGGNSVLANVDVPMPGIVCLGDVLNAHGYHTLFYGGARLAFAGKGRFLETHGFQEVFGRARLTELLGDEVSQSGWGVYDQQLLSVAAERIDLLEQADAPYAMALLTLDTHHPSGFPSPGCGEMIDGIVGAVGCSDRLLAPFIERIRRRYPDTLVVLFSDHLSHRNDAIDQLQQDVRNLRFVVFDAERAGIDVARPGTHFDVMATVMDFLGLQQYHVHNLGASLLRSDSPWFVDADRRRELLDQQALGLELKLEDRVVFEVAGPSIDFGSARITATDQGLPLKRGIFAVEFNDNGTVSRFLDSRHMEVFLEETGDKLLVGVSADPEFNASLSPEEPATTLWFVGRFGSEGLRVGPLWWRQEVQLDNL